MNKIFDALARINKFLDVVGSIAVGISVLAVTVAIFKPVFFGIGDSAVTVAEVAAQRVSLAVTTLFAKNSKNT